ncbi:MAG: hypothetical protein BGO98_26895 [Myxococcales bacterium 68-20]|mgnify:FL=1|nr:hypothetical protein [Myxococcales bacterium]OJY30355.1 MAG: hypothetical protein BGO98_26895 [Myxococcales bacterium 68-20]
MSFATEPRVSLVLAVMMTAFVACTSDRAAYIDPPSYADAGPPESAFVSPEAGTGDAGPHEVECAGGEDFVYVLSKGPDAIHRFEPKTLAFSRLGYLQCPDSGTFSMAIDRYDTAWILYTSGRLFKVRLDDLRCDEIVLRGRTPELFLFGMGFSKNDSGDGETLYLGQDGLWKVDTKTLEVGRVGATELGYTFELTGTGDGQLYGYASLNGTVLHIDKTSGQTLERHRTPAIGSSWAFAQWGGDFWLFVTSGMARSSVTRYSPTMKTSTVVIEDSGIEIVGAGSSTCVPYKPVQ